MAEEHAEAEARIPTASTIRCPTSPTLQEYEGEAEEENSDSPTNVLPLPASFIPLADAGRTSPAGRAPPSPKTGREPSVS